MHVLSVGGAGAEWAIETLASTLGERGRVARLTRQAQGVSAPDHTNVTLDTTGTWRATGNGGGGERWADRLAADHDYLLLSGTASPRWPRLVATDHEVRGDLLPEPVARDRFDPSIVVDRLEDGEPYETRESLIRRAEASPDSKQAGAIATFTGRVRAKDAPDDEETEYLEFEKYAGVANKRLRELETELKARDGVFEVLLHHRTGVIEAEEDIVFVVVLAGHREEAFRTVEDGINRLKAEVPIFKKEVTVGEEYWVHTRP